MLMPSGAADLYLGATHTTGIDNIHSFPDVNGILRMDSWSVGHSK